MFSKRLNLIIVLGLWVLFQFLFLHHIISAIAKKLMNKKRFSGFQSEEDEAGNNGYTNNKLMKSLPVICVAASCLYVWIRFAGQLKNSCQVNDASKENDIRSDDEVSLSLNVKDRLNELPCDVTSQIFSHFSIRDVVRVTSVSRHCKNVCLALPRLVLDWYAITGVRNIGFHTQNCEPYAHAYLKSVDQVLNMYRDQNILSFHLSCCLNSKTYGGDIDRWMSFVATNKGLQTLSLQFICEDSWRKFFNRKDDELHLVSGSFLCQFSHLKYLHLDACILRLEKEFKLSNLTILDLNYVILEVGRWQDFFSCFSTIKRLWLRGCKLPFKLCIGNNFPCLSFLMIGGCLDLRELEVSACKLQRFELHTAEDLKCSFFNVSYLEKVYFFPVAICCAEDILNNLAAKVPSLYCFFLRGKRSLMHKLPSSTANLFHSVTSLRISMNIDDGNILAGLPRLLKSFPELKELEMKLPQEPCYKTSELPDLYTHTKLQYIEIFELQVEYIPIAHYLLKSAGVLKRMMVTKASKGLIGYENLHWFCTKKRYSDEERLTIQKALIGKASSTNVGLIIK